MKALNITKSSFPLLHLVDCYYARSILRKIETRTYITQEPKESIDYCTFKVSSFGSQALAQVHRGHNIINLGKKQAFSGDLISLLHTAGPRCAKTTTGPEEQSVWLPGNFC